MTDHAIKSTIESNWGPTSEFTRMRFLDAKIYKPGCRGTAYRSVSTGKVLFKLSDPTALLQVLVPRCRKGHPLSDVPKNMNFAKECSGAECSAIVDETGKLCLQEECVFASCPKCLYQISRSPLRVPYHDDQPIQLKVKKARGAITYPKKQSQLFIHAFPMETGDKAEPPVSRLTFATILAKRLGFDDAGIELGKKKERLEVEETDLPQLIDLDTKVEAKGLHVSNLVALTLAQLLVLQVERGAIPNLETALGLADKIKYYVLDHSHSSMRPRPFCFFLELLDTDAAHQLKTLLHDTIFEMTYEDVTAKMLLDVQFRGDEKVKKGSILEQNKTVPAKRYQEAQENAVLQVKKFMSLLAKGEYPNERDKQLKISGKGLNTKAKPFTPGGGVGGGSTITGGDDRQLAMQIRKIQEMIHVLEADQGVEAHKEGKIGQYISKMEQVAKAQYMDHDKQLTALKESVQSLIVHRELEATARATQISNLTLLARSVLFLLPTAENFPLAPCDEDDEALWNKGPSAQRAPQW
eukprot:TRINITY_DN6883_c0_g2_i1.p1 TRINITY_DN6883_c0_g2~~TRINITY_DN6883_c0_g2_i1.p1  ORF type:complete len:547 (+),score=112.63 TRINITY_DN6883_c0_g2_i1:72-1643(+)